MKQNGKLEIILGCLAIIFIVPILPFFYVGTIIYQSATGREVTIYRAKPPPLQSEPEEP